MAYLYWHAANYEGLGRTGIAGVFIASCVAMAGACEERVATSRAVADLRKHKVVRLSV